MIPEGIKGLSSYCKAAGYTIPSRIVQLNQVRLGQLHLDQVRRLPQRHFYCSLELDTATRLLALHRYLLVGVINHRAAQA